MRNLILMILLSLIVGCSPSNNSDNPISNPLSIVDDGLPSSCESDEVKEILVDALSSTFDSGYRNGESCALFESKTDWKARTVTYFRVLLFPKRNDSKPYCGETDRYIDDVVSDISTFIVRSEEKSKDGYSLNCSLKIETKTVSNQIPMEITRDFNNVNLTIFKKGKDGSVHYEHNIHRPNKESAPPMSVPLQFEYLSTEDASFDQADNKQYDLPKLVEGEDYENVRSKMMAAGWETFDSYLSADCPQNDSRCANRPEFHDCLNYESKGRSEKTFCQFLWKIDNKVVGICTTGESDTNFIGTCRPLGLGSLGDNLH